MIKKAIIITIVCLFVCLALPKNVMAANTIGLINDTTGIVRTTAAQSGTQIRTLSPGDAVTINRSIINSAGNTWYDISFYVNGVATQGFIYSSHVTIYKTDSSFEAVLSSFPESYKTPMRYLHCLYPKWTFKKLTTNLDFNTAASKYQPKAYIDGSDEALRENNTIVEGSNWFNANLKTTAYFLDPRNMLNSYTALMFEDLSYNETANLEQLEKMLQGTYMDDIEQISGKRWAQLYLEAGSVANCSPSFLVTRAIQEQGTSGTGGLGSQGGTSKIDLADTTVYYNIFNIGANTGAQDGIEYAKKQGWTTREASIIGGAKYVSQNYINKKQNSLYLQRFNVDPNSPYGAYSHSYMANVRAPWSEGKKTFKNYEKNDLLSESKVLIIPVFNNMPESTPYPGTMDKITIDPVDTKPLYLNGDVDGDSSITAVDYMLIKNHIMETKTLAGDMLARADVDGDGSISAVDYMLIKNDIMDIKKLN